MIEEKFAQGSSFLHQRDPRGKITAAFLYTMSVAFLHSVQLLFFCLAVSLLLSFLARMPIIPLLKRLALVNVFTLFIWITLPLTYGGEQTYGLGFLDISRGGVLLAVIITLKTNAIILAILSLLATSTVAELGYAMEKLRLPRKLVFILLYSYRYVFVIHREYLRLLRAAKMRSFRPRTNLHTYRTFSYLFAMTLVNSYNRSQRVHQAMVLRGFNGRLVSLHHHNFTFTDTLFLSLILLISTVLVIAPLWY